LPANVAHDLPGKASKLFKIVNIYGGFQKCEKVPDFPVKKGTWLKLRVYSLSGTRIDRRSVFGL